VGLKDIRFRRINRLFIIYIVMKSKITKSSNNDMLNIYKMTFIYNAVMNGWTVKKLKNNNFEFTNNKEELKKEFYLDNFLEDFINSNFNIDKIITKL
tara:strand:+ start:242 stop:532 length:291 start_codon:yes stop_codon:yes gene_type:complete